MSQLKADLTVLQVPAEPDVNIIFEQAEMISFYPFQNHVICLSETLKTDSFTSFL